MTDIARIMVGWRTSSSHWHVTSMLGEDRLSPEPTPGYYRQDAMVSEREMEMHRDDLDGFIKRRTAEILAKQWTIIARQIGDGR